MNRLCCKIWCLLLLAAVLFSCSEIDSCQHDLSGSGMNVSLYRMVFDVESEAYVAEAYYLPLSVAGVGIDSLLYDSTRVSKITLPLQMYDTASSFHIVAYHAVDDTTVVQYTDTLTIVHDNEQKFVSLECGCVVDHNIVTVNTTVHGVDSVIVENSAVSYRLSDNNLKLYFRNR